MQPEAQLTRLGLKLPEPPKAVATYSSWVRSGNFLFVAGQGPMENGQPKFKGKLGQNVTLDQGYQAARLSALNCLAVAASAVGGLSKIRRAVRALVFVACTDTFTQQPQVANGATDLLKEVFGEANLPARVAVGTNVLPMDIAVEVELEFEIA